jgi:hypothetical protein
MTNQNDYKLRWRNTPEGYVLFLRSHEEGKPDEIVAQACLAPALQTAIVLVVLRSPQGKPLTVEPVVSITSGALSLEETLELAVWCFEESGLETRQLQPNSIDWFAFPSGAKERAQANRKKQLDQEAADAACKKEPN